jgi:hypothetical protein
VSGFLLLAACAAEASRSGATTLAPGDRVALWLLRYETCREHVAADAGNCEPKPAPAEVRQRFLECLTPALGRHGASAVLRDEAATALAVPVAELRVGIAAPAAVEALVAASARREAFRADTARYLLVLQATTHDGPRYTDGGIDLTFTGAVTAGPSRTGIARTQRMDGDRLVHAGPAGAIRLPHRGRRVRGRRHRRCGVPGRVPPSRGQ